MRPARLRKSFTAYIRDHAAGVAIIAGVALPVLVGGMALGTEAGYWYLSQRKLQQASDLAAYAAASQLRSGRAEARMLDAADVVATRSGAREGEDILTVNSPPASGAFAGEADAVEVVLTRSQTRFFTLIYESGNVDISARSVAAIQGGGDACLLALDPTAGGAITVTGSSTVTFDGCDVATNSNAEDAFLMSGGAVEMTTGCVNSVGGAVVTSNLNLTDCLAPREQGPVIEDPYADVPQPEVSGTCLDSKVGKNNQIVTLTPTEILSNGLLSMRFCGGLDIKGTVLMSPGVYIVDGGTFRVNAGALLTGTGVTIFLTDGAELAFNGAATINLDAPTSGPLSGILVFGDRADVGVGHLINGTAASTLSGAFYTPSADLDYRGNFTGSNGCTQVVTRRISFSGNSALTVDCTAAGTRRIAVDENIVLVE